MCIFIKKKLNAQSDTHIEVVERDWHCCLWKMIKSRAGRKLMVFFISVSTGGVVSGMDTGYKVTSAKVEENRAVAHPGGTGLTLVELSLWGTNSGTWGDSGHKSRLKAK